jgi:GGDEF domain-containing protein
MKRIRLPVACLVLWLFLFYNIERLSKPINISQVAYIFLPTAAALMLLYPPLHKVNAWLVLSVSSVTFLVLEAWLGNGLGVPLPLVVTQVCAIVVTLLLARRVSASVTEFEHAVVNMTFGHFTERRTRQGEIYREVQRARVHHRPLMLVAIKADDTSMQVALDRMVQEAQQAMMKQYVLTGVSKVLSDELDDYNIVAKRHDHFLIVLPEMTPEKLPNLLSRLKKAAGERIGVTLKVGAASLSRDVTTFEGLVQRAVGAMEEMPAAVPWSPRLAASLAVDGVSVQEQPHGHGDRQST